MPLVENKGNGAAREAARRVAYVEGANRWTRRAFGALEPDTLNGVLLTAQRGDLQDWVDLASFIRRTDPHVSSVWETAVSQVLSAELQIEPAESADTALAEAAADFLRREWDRCPVFHDRLADLLEGDAVGVAVIEHDWRVEGDVVRSHPMFVHSRNLRFRGEWRVELRTGEQGSFWRYVDEFPRKFVVHAPHSSAEYPTLRGEMMRVAWPWLFKRWCEKFALAGLEKLANGLLWGKYAPDAPDAVRDELKSGLEDISSDGVAIFPGEPGGDPVGLLEMQRDPGASLKSFVDHFNGEITKALLGSSLNVEVESTGGNRALGEQQDKVTIIPRAKARARRLVETLLAQWARPLFEFNTLHFGGRVPPMPRVQFVLDREAPPIVDDLMVQAGAATVDELRRSRGHAEWGGPEGGAIVRVAAPAAPFTEAPAGGADAAPPFAPMRASRSPRRSRATQQLSIPATSSPTSSPFATSPLGRALSGKSGGRAR